MKRTAQRVCKWCQHVEQAWMKCGRCRECACLEKRTWYAFEADGLRYDMALIGQTTLALGQGVL